MLLLSAVSKALQCIVRFAGLKPKFHLLGFAYLLLKHMLQNRFEIVEIELKSVLFIAYSLGNRLTVGLVLLDFGRKLL